MFFARWDLGAPWNSQGIEGTARWLRRAWALFTGSIVEQEIQNNADHRVLRDLRRKLHQTLRQVTNDFIQLEFNTIVSALMELLNDMYKAREAGAENTPEWDEAVDIYLRMMAPVVPHIAEEIWSLMNKPYSVHTQSWPSVDENAAAEEMIVLIVQVNGKVRDRISMPVNVSEEEAKDAALRSAGVQKYIEEPPKKIIYVPGRLVNIVI